MTADPPHEIVLVRLSAIGDVVHTIPLLQSLRAAFPLSRITWIIQPGPWQLVRDHPAVDEFILFERRPLLRGLLALRRRLHGRKFDLALIPHSALKAGLIAAMIDAPRKIGFDRNRSPEFGWLFTNDRIPPGPRLHQQDEILLFADYLGIGRVGDSELESTPEEVAEYEGLLPPWRGQTIAIGGGSSRSEKNWPVERYVELAERLLADPSLRLVVVGAPTVAEDAAAEAIRAVAGDRLLDLRAWDLRRLVFLLSRSDVFVGPDSGPMHIAVALGTPTVALMGFTNPRRVGPVRFQDLMVDAFTEPGETVDAEPTTRPGRMERIDAAEVAARVRKALARPDPEDA